MAFNGAARVIYGERRSCHITPLLERLHWLRVEERVVFKLCLTVFKALHGQAPLRLTELCALDITERRPLRSAAHSSNMIVVPNRANKSNFSDRAFSVAGPVAWNRLPADIRRSETVTQFGREMKCALFKQSFPRP